MALINKFSMPSIRGQVDLFSLPPTDTTVESSFYAEYKPLVNIQDSESKLEFRIVGNTIHLLDLFDHFLYLKVQVVNGNGTVLDESHNVSTANLFMHSLFSKVEVFINGNLISTSNLYHYKAFLETLLTFDKNYLESQGTCALWYDDTDEDVSAKNTGFTERSAHISKSQKLEMIDKLRIDMANQHRYILNNTTVVISLTKNTDSFALMHAAVTPPSSGGTGGEPPTTPSNPLLNPKVRFLDASLYIRKHVLYPSIILSHQKLLESGHSALYPFKMSDVKAFSIPAGNQVFVEENMFLGSIPSRIVVALLPSSSFVGTYTSNPFIFKDYSMSYLALNVNNIPIPIKGMGINFSEGSYLLPYYLMFCSLGMNGQNQALNISRETFKKLFPLFVFDVAQEHAADSTLTLEKTGAVRLELQFKTALPHAVTCLVYCEHQKIMEIDKYRQAKVY
jgi:hypothetical protein